LTDHHLMDDHLTDVNNKNRNRNGRSGMGDKWSEAFIKALKDGDTERVKQIPKADLHNHFVLGGSRAFIRERKGLVIPALEGILESMQEMDRWNQEYIGKYFESGEGRRFLIEAAFVQAREDGVTVLEIGEDVWGLRPVG